jgi:hypothetical protein
MPMGHLCWPNATKPLLANISLNKLPVRVGLESYLSDNFKPRDLVACLMVFFAMLFATVEAAHRLDFVQVEEWVGRFIQFGGDVLLGVAILLVGFWLAGALYRAILRGAGEDAAGVACIARYVVLGLVLAIGLSAMGISDDIVNMAFVLVFGTVAVVALSFGLRGREAAGWQMDYWLSKLLRGDTAFQVRGGTAVGKQKSRPEGRLSLQLWELLLLGSVSGRSRSSSVSSRGGRSRSSGVSSRSGRSRGSLRSGSRSGSFRSRSGSGGFFFLTTGGQAEGQKGGEQDGIFHLAFLSKKLINKYVILSRTKPI